MGVIAENAAQYARAGWRVFPVDAGSKRPRTPHGHLDASADEQRVRGWAMLFDSGGAIATPTGDGLFVLDVDPRSGGKVPAWAPETRTVRTQSGGLHLHYAIDEDIKSRAGLFGPGLDSKSAGGYVLLPPSPGYEWASDAPRARITKLWLMNKIAPTQVRGAEHAADRLPPDQWRRGIIHDQVVAWAAYFAGVMDDDREVHEATWAMVNQARAAGVLIDNARDHIGGAIRWVLERERAKNGPTLA